MEDVLVVHSSAKKWEGFSLHMNGRLCTLYVRSVKGYGDNTLAVKNGKSMEES